MTKLKIAYFGSPNFSAEFLERLVTDTLINQLIDVVLVVTQPDRPVGRKRIVTPTPVKQIAIKNNIPIAEGVASEVTFREADSASWRRASQERRDHKRQNLLQLVDFALVYAFNQKIPEDLLALPRLGFINVHPSLLPKYRGPAPIAAPLINGDKKTGVTIIQMDEEIDHGPIISQEELEILSQDRRPDLERKLTNLAFKIFCNLIKGERACFEASLGFTRGVKRAKKRGTEPFLQQNHQQATYTKLLKKSDGFVPLEKLKKVLDSSLTRESVNLSISINNLFRGLFNWPGIWTLLPSGKRLKITDMNFDGKKITIKKVQLEGKREVDFPTFQKAYKFF